MCIYIYIYTYILHIYIRYIHACAPMPSSMAIVTIPCFPCFYPEKSSKNRLCPRTYLAWAGNAEASAMLISFHLYPLKSIA